MVGVGLWVWSRVRAAVVAGARLMENGTTRISESGVPRTLE